MRATLFNLLKTAGLKVQPKHQEFLDEHFSVDPKWKKFRAKLRSPSFVDAVKADTRADKKLQRYSDGNAKHLQARGVPTFPVPSQSSGSKTYDVKYHPDIDRFTCNCGDWIHKRSWRQGQTTRDCKHIWLVKNELKNHGTSTEDFVKEAAWDDMYHASTVQGLKTLKPDKSKIYGEPVIYAGWDPEDVARYALSWMHQINRGDGVVGVPREHAHRLKQPASIYKIKYPDKDEDLMDAGPGTAILVPRPVLEEKRYPSIEEMWKQHDIKYRIEDTDKTAMKKAASRILAHISGPSGSGKTTLLNKLKEKHPDLVTEDLDVFDDQASASLFPGKRKSEYTDDNIRALAASRQKLMDEFLKAQGDRPVVLGGHHTEGDTVLNIPTENRWMLDTGPLKSAWRGYLRDDTRRLTELPSDYREAKGTVQELKGLGYSSMSAHGVEDKIKTMLQSKS